MPENSVTYNFARTINMGNYESIRFEIGETRTVNDGEDAEEIYKDIRKTVNGRMKTIVSKLREENDG
jgi:hypothetical protein